MGTQFSKVYSPLWKILLRWCWHGSNHGGPLRKKEAFSWTGNCSPKLSHISTIFKAVVDSFILTTTSRAYRVHLHTSRHENISSRNFFFMGTLPHVASDFWLNRMFPNIGPFDCKRMWGRKSHHGVDSLLWMSSPTIFSNHSPCSDKTYQTFLFSSCRDQGPSMMVLRGPIPVQLSSQNSTRLPKFITYLMPLSRRKTLWSMAVPRWRASRHREWAIPKIFSF